MFKHKHQFYAAMRWWSNEPLVEEFHDRFVTQNVVWLLARSGMTEFSLAGTYSVLDIGLSLVFDPQANDLVD